MASTQNLNLAKPAGTDKALVSVINSNSDKIDAFAGTTNQALSNININLGQFTSKATTISSGSMNDLKTSGIYAVYNLSGLPTGVSIAVCLVMQYSPDWISQMLISLNPSGRRGHIFTRSYHSGTTWSTWGELIPTETT